jgi:hypothetical protein
MLVVEKEKVRVHLRSPRECQDCLRHLHPRKFRRDHTTSILPATNAAMMLPRVYVPSRALLRALARPQPIRCRFSRPVIAENVRGKRTKAAKPEKAEYNAPNSVDSDATMEQIKTFESNLQDDSKIDQAMRPLSDKELESDDLPAINWLELDLEKGTPPRLIDRIATVEDRKRDKEMFTMIEQSQQNPDYDDAILNRRLLDSLISNPNFADLADELKDMKEEIKTKEELKALEEQAAKDAEPEIQQFRASMRMEMYQALHRLVDDPDFADAKGELRQVMDNMPDVEDIDKPEFQAVLDQAMEKVNSNPAMQEKLAAMATESVDDKFEKEWQDMEKNVNEALDENGGDDADVAMDTAEDFEDIDKLLRQMRDVMQSIGGDSGLDAELDAVINEDPEEAQQGDFDREMDPEELAEELKKLAEAGMSAAKKAENDADVPAELQAKVDKIMEDPRLMEKLMYIRKLIAEKQKADITTVSHETAPDPYELEEDRTATLKERMRTAREDPEHAAALDRLHVKLLPPFNIAPALKSFNQAIEFAYVGANDDIRRILWRSYQKARTLPTFLQNMSDEAWDIMYYSQAVTWGSNQNRQSHLRMLLADLKSLGRDGPPTHPSTLADQGDASHLEA